MECGKRIALGLAGGYLLGRGKKGGLLLLAAALLTGGNGPVQRGAAALGGGELAKLTDQGRQAVQGLVSSGIEALADRLHDKTEALRRPAGEGATESRDESGEADEQEGEDEDLESDYDESARDDDEESPESSRPRLSKSRRGVEGRERRSLAGGPARR